MLFTAKALGIYNILDDYGRVKGEETNRKSFNLPPNTKIWECFIYYSCCFVAVVVSCWYLCSFFSVLF